MKPSLYSLLKFVDLTSQLRHSLVVYPLLGKILDPPHVCWWLFLLLLSTFCNKQIKKLKTWQDHFLLTRYSFEKYSKKKTDTPCENLRFFKSSKIGSSGVLIGNLGQVVSSGRILRRYSCWLLAKINKLGFWSLNIQYLFATVKCIFLQYEFTMSRTNSLVKMFTCNPHITTCLILLE